MNFLFFISAIFTKLILKNRSEFDELLEKICRHDAFSKIEMDFSSICLFPELMKECKLWECFFKEAGNLKRTKNAGDSRLIIDLLLNSESYTGYKKGAREIWERLDEVNSNKIYKIFLSGVKQSVNVHKAAFFKERGYEFLKNIMLYNSTCRNSLYVRNFQTLKAFLLLALKNLQIENDISYVWLERLKSHINMEIKTIPGVGQLFKDLENVTDILGCIACQKCRLWSTIQFKGLATACKIMSGEKITNQDLVYFLNFLNRICVAEDQADTMEAMLENYYWYIFVLYRKEMFTLSLAVLLFLAILVNKS